MFCFFLLIFQNPAEQIFTNYSSFSPNVFGLDNENEDEKSSEASNPSFDSSCSSKSPRQKHADLHLTHEEISGYHSDSGMKFPDEYSTNGETKFTFVLLPEHKENCSVQLPVFRPPKTPQRIPTAKQKIVANKLPEIVPNDGFHSLKENNVWIGHDILFYFFSEV